MERKTGIIVGIVAIVLVAVAASVFLLSTAPSKIRIVSLQTGWAFVGRDAPYFVAMEKGYYEEEGLSLRVFRGYGGGDVLKNIEAKLFDFGEPGAGNYLAGVDAGGKAKAVAIHHLNSVSGYVVRNDSDIYGPKDFEGKIYATTFASEGTLLLPALLEINGVDPDTVKMVNVNTATAIPMLLTGESDIMGFYSESPSYEMWKSVRHIAVEDWGMHIYGNVFVAHEDLIRDEPDVVRKFLRATFKGHRDAMEDPEEAAEIMYKYRPELALEDIKVGLGHGLLGMLGDPEKTEELGLGWATDEKWEFTLDFLIEVLDIEESPLERIYTNDFLPKTYPPANAEAIINAFLEESMP